LLIDKFPPVRWLRETFLRLGTSDDEGNLTGGVGPRVLRGLTHSIAYVWTCPWCMSVWAGAGLVALADVWFSVPYPWLVVAAGSLATGLASQREAEHEQRWKLAQRKIDTGA
ncbi:MAG TPA: DUF1360 domain-containing protein, partial [Actinoplanes sp.]|nr:DUF1360 domain-containing protein [Actinoplanes sp.]